MGDAILLFFALPGWYFASLSFPSQNMLTGIPVTGIFALLFGTILGLAGQTKRLLLWILVSVAISQLYVIIAGFFRGQLAAGSSEWLFYALLFVQLAIVAILVWRSQGNRVAACLLGWFGMTYAFYAGFVGAMALTDAWL